MAIVDAIAGLFGWRRVVVYDHSVVATAIQGMTPVDLYRRQPALRAVVSFLADNVAGVPVKCYVREGDTDRPRDTESALALLLSRPNPGMTTFELVRATESDLKLWGQSLWYVTPDADAQSGWRIQYIPWAWVDGKETWDGFEPSAHRVTNPYTGARVELPAADCVRFFSYSPMGTMEASSPIEALKDVLSEQISAWEFRNGVWRNGGRVQQWISRPQGAEWTPEARNRWAKSWKERFSGKGGTDTGGTPLLEDGMRLEVTQLNAREAQWQEATRLAREDVAAVYHVNPSQIWHTESQTYASAKDNARALYADTLANDFALIEQRINARLVPMLGMDPATHYCEFDLSSKLAASFEEQASVLQSSVGGPWMLRNEARARLNLPAIDGGDELIVPRNVTEGGLASPNDTDPTKGVPATAEQVVKAIVEALSFDVAQPRRAAESPVPAKDVRVEPPGGDAVPFGDGAPKVAVTLLKTSSEPPEDSVALIQDVLTRVMERQARRVFADLQAGEAASKARKAADDYPWWWDMLRWDRELGDDLEPLFRQLCDLRGMAAMADIEEPTSAWDSRRTTNFVRAMAERRAHLFNEGTMKQLAATLSALDIGDPGALSHAELSFLDHAENRAVRGALTFATAVCGFATKEAVRQVYPRDTDTVRRTKTWRHHGSKNPRSTHAAMDGETVGLDERFSNGADYPGDLGLPAEETVNCHCTIDVGVEKHDGGGFGGGGSNPPTDGGNGMDDETARAVAQELGLSDDYMPTKVYRAYGMCQQTIGQDAANWAELTLEQRNAVLSELRTRDRDWVTYGEIPKTDYSLIDDEEIGRIKPWERQTWSDLAEHHGIAPLILPEDSDVANIDAWYHREFWELKNPGNGKHSMEDLIHDAVKKWKKLGIQTKPKVIVSNSRSTRADSDALDEALRRCKWYGVGELLYVAHDGLSIRRFFIK